MVIIIMGVSGCGKTTVGTELSERIGCQFLDADDFHAQASIEKMSDGIPLTEADRAPWLDSLRGSIEQFLKNSEHLVLACSALSQQNRAVLRGDSGDVRFVYLQGGKELIGQRLQDRKGHFASADLLDSQFDALEEPNSALTVSVTMSPNEIVALVCGELGLKSQ